MTIKPESISSDGVGRIDWTNLRSSLLLLICDDASALKLVDRSSKGRFEGVVATIHKSCADILKTGAFKFITPQDYEDYWSLRHMNAGYRYGFWIDGEGVITKYLNVFNELSAKYLYCDESVRYYGDYDLFDGVDYNTAYLFCEQFFVIDRIHMLLDVVQPQKVRCYSCFKDDDVAVATSFICKYRNIEFRLTES